MSWDLNRQAKALLACLGAPWLLVLLAVLLLSVLLMLAWLGVIIPPFTNVATG
jgi:hypothetical protein